ncbi:MULTISPECIES: LysR family transcriptional regulator [Massilia]|uniref:LysR family transcriptional regulator n=2 Tax=Massilia TaxID=149698 RepID=A0ABX0N9J8_9BURK|nr:MULTISPECIES: LysR family transcriptional regulator [Massilia]NHZ66819.1 LysR family transcriptional regulator [Massilia genomosp. 1]NHZ93036.1 LysR family transcriptional regulator [Massilia mucilaginosa]
MENLSALHDMALFVEVARTMSFSRASTKLGVPGATLSRRIAAMERHFGVRLLDRNTRKVALSEAGQRYFERCAHLVDEARAAQEALSDTVNRPIGHVRVSMPVDLGLTYIGPLLPDFARQYPGISLDLDLSPRHSNLVTEHVDLAIRLGEVVGDQLVVRRLGSLEHFLFAAPSYLALHGQPQQPAELVEHTCITTGSAQQASNWHLQRDGCGMDVQVRGHFGINNPGLIRLLAERGLGIAALSHKLAREAVSAERLVRVLPDWSFKPVPVSGVMATRMQTASVRVLVEFLAARLSLE